MPIRLQRPRDEPLVLGDANTLMTYNIISFYIAKNKLYIHFRSSEIHKFMAIVVFIKWTQLRMWSAGNRPASLMIFGGSVAYTSKD